MGCSVRGVDGRDRCLRSRILHREKPHPALGPGGGTKNEVHSYSPAVDVEETEDSFVLRADLPGLNEKDVDIKVDGDELVLSGSRENSREENGSRIRERRFGKFVRKFKLGPRVKSDGIEASYTSGVLTISVPKSEDAKPRQIPVTVH